MTLTLEQEACNFITMRHIERVRNLLNDVVVQLLERGQKHDQTKLESPEVELFTLYTGNLAKTEYESPEYIENKRNLSVALEHHYARNSHHPEFHRNGINDMTLIDLLEMFVDWKAGSERQNNGNINTSIEKNAKKFAIDSQLVRIFQNTAKAMWDS